jgi:hypothetical protein
LLIFVDPFNVPRPKYARSMCQNASRNSIAGKPPCRASYSIDFPNGVATNLPRCMRTSLTLSVYVHHAYEQEKREALELWADRLRGIIAGGAEVVPIKGSRR